MTYEDLIDDEFETEFHVAADNNNLEVLKWLDSTFGLIEKDRIKYINTLLRNIRFMGGHSEMLEWFSSTYGLEPHYNDDYKK